MATGHRIRIVRLSDNVVIYDSGLPVGSVNEMILDTATFAGTETYSLQAMYINQGDQISRTPILGRQTMVAMCLEK